MWRLLKLIGFTLFSVPIIVSIGCAITASVVYATKIARTKFFPTLFAADSKTKQAIQQKVDPDYDNILSNIGSLFKWGWSPYTETIQATKDGFEELLERTGYGRAVEEKILSPTLRKKGHEKVIRDSENLFERRAGVKKPNEQTAERIQKVIKEKQTERTPEDTITTVETPSKPIKTDDISIDITNKQKGKSEKPSKTPRPTSQRILGTTNTQEGTRRTP